MESSWLAAAGLFVFGLFYRKYARWLAGKRVFDCDESLTTPAHAQRDEMDYVPASRHVLFGHHFTSIAGAAPIVGPAIAVIWGWLPAFLWVVLGSVVIGCVHDFGNLVLSAKNKGRSLADLTGDIIGPTSRHLLLILVLLLTWIVLAVFAVVIGILFSSFPQTIIPINLEITAAIIIGFLVYRINTKMLIPSLVVLGLLYGSVIWSADEERYTLVPQALRTKITIAEAQAKDPKEFSIQKTQELAAGSTENAAELSAAKFVGNKNNPAVKNWIWLLLGYSAIASLLPVWMLLQPRDLINSHQLFVGLGLMFISVLRFNPPVVAPMIVTNPQGAGPLFPLLFITIACGAISGFHGLVASGTTSKQLDSMKDARFVGYGGMLGEACLGLMAVLACTAGFATPEAWSSHYGTWSSANGLMSKVTAFVDGGSSFLTKFLFEYIPGLSASTAMQVSVAIVAVLVISFAATTLDSACRIQRLILQEIGSGLKIRPLTNRYIATAIAAFTPILLVIGDKPLWKELWPVFGATNQLLGALALLVLSVYLARKKRVVWPVLLPAGYLLVITFSSLILKFMDFKTKGLTTLMVISGLLMALAAWITIEALRILKAWFDGRLSQGEFNLN